MKMIPCPEAGDRVIIGPFKATEPGTEDIPETEAKVVVDEQTDHPIYDFDEDNWQVAVDIKDEGADLTFNIRWDEIAGAWRDAE